ncbi:TPA: nuclear transport factor 2 family protein [Providencia stuartii]|nr:nuclear transport factor 2 family protein [Providencia stuartii]
MSNLTLVQRALVSVLGNDIGNLSAIEQYFSPDYIQIVDGKKIDYTEFVAHLNALKNAVESISITIKSIAEGDGCVHTQHIACAKKKNGEISEFEVFACFHLSNNKIICCEELTRMINGKKADEDLGSRI